MAYLLCNLFILLCHKSIPHTPIQVSLSKTPSPTMQCREETGRAAAAQLQEEKTEKDLLHVSKNMSQS